MLPQKEWMNTSSAKTRDQPRFSLNSFGKIVVALLFIILNPFTPKISLVILLSIFYTILMMLARIICYWINYQSLYWHLSFSHHLSAWYCIDFIRRNSFLVSHGSSGTKQRLPSSHASGRCFKVWHFSFCNKYTTPISNNYAILSL